jgi:hypothetical protein
MEEQLKNTMFKAMRDILKERVNATSKLDKKDVDWLVSLCKELKSRINDLTPSRGDLHVELDKAVDVELIQQMLLNDAFDKDEARKMVDFIFERLKLLCAPSEDAKIAQLHINVLTCTDFGEQISSLIIESNMIIDTIERMVETLKKQSEN